MFNRFIVINDKDTMLEGDRIIFAIWRLSLAYLSPDGWDTKWEVRLNLNDAWFEIRLGCLDLAFYRGGQEFWKDY